MSEYVPVLTEEKMVETVRAIPVEELADFAKVHQGFVDAVAIRLRELRDEMLKRTDHVKDRFRKMKTERMVGHHEARRTNFIRLCDEIIQIQESIYQEDDTCPKIMRPKVWIPLESNLLIEITKAIKYLEEAQRTFFVRSIQDMSTETNTVTIMIHHLRELYHTLHEEYYKCTFTMV